MISKRCVSEKAYRYAPTTSIRRQWTSLADRCVSPHTIRHTTATHVLRAGVDINTIRAWLGHVSIDTTNIYVEIDLERKAQMLEKTNALHSNPVSKRPWKENPSLMAFLRSL